MECIARWLNRIYAKYQSLRAIVMVLFGRVKCVRLAYLRKGHTHEDIDAFYGQLSARLMREEFNNIDDTNTIKRGCGGSTASSVQEQSS